MELCILKRLKKDLTAFSQIRVYCFSMTSIVSGIFIVQDSYNSSLIKCLIMVDVINSDAYNDLL